MSVIADTEEKATIVTQDRCYSLYLPELNEIIPLNLKHWVINLSFYSDYNLSSNNETGDITIKFNSREEKLMVLVSTLWNVKNLDYLFHQRPIHHDLGIYQIYNTCSMK